MTAIEIFFIWGISVILSGLFTVSFLMELKIEWLLKSPLDYTISDILLRFLCLPCYYFILIYFIVLAPFVLLKTILDIVISLDKVKTFLNHKPLEFLKNYKITITKKG